MPSAPNGAVSSMYVAKYNRFVDSILGRINNILKEKYDPVTVKLANPTTSSSGTKKTSKTSSKKTKRRKSSSKRRKSSKRKNAVRAASLRNDDEQQRVQQFVNGSDLLQQQQINAENPQPTTLMPMQTDVVTTMAPETATRLVTNEVSPTSSSTRVGTIGKRKKNSATRNTSSTKAAKRPASSNKKKATPAATSSKRQRSKAKATLFGLASLKRSGDVSVNMMSDHTTIRTKFNLGPLVLKVEKEFGRATRKEVRSATATTAEMSGRLSLRVYHSGAATLHSIRVLQPKQMRIESADDHDRTREFVWKRSSHIAHLVSQKLSSATRSMLRPPPAASAA